MCRHRMIMDKKTKLHTVAKAVRLEHNDHNDDVFIVFKIIDEQFKRRIMNDWQQDVEMQLIGKSLVLEEEE